MSDANQKDSHLSLQQEVEIWRDWGRAWGALDKEQDPLNALEVIAHKLTRLAELEDLIVPLLEASARLERLVNTPLEVSSDDLVAAAARRMRVDSDVMIELYNTRRK